MVGGQDNDEWLPAVAERPARVRAGNWPSTPLGPVSRWPPGLRIAADLTASALLRDLSERLVTQDNTGTIYEEILTVAIAIMKSDAGTVQVYDPETHSLVLLVTRNFDRRMIDHFHRVDADSRTACG